MKTYLTALTVLGMALASGLQTNSKVRTTDSLTGLPLSPATDPGMNFGNEPTAMHDATICKSKMQGQFYSLFHVTTDAIAAWYTQNLKGFKMAKGTVSERQQIAFYKPDGTVVVVITGERGTPDAYSVAYERYSPGLPEKVVINGLTQGNIDCR